MQYRNATLLDMTKKRNKVRSMDDRGVVQYGTGAWMRRENRITDKIEMT
jgi:hypothetical protein